jgi:hypothetical protein
MPAPTFIGLGNVNRHLRESFDDVACIVVQRVINRNDNERVASMQLSPDALRPFLVAQESRPAGAVPSADDLREAILAWLRHTFAVDMNGEPRRQYKVGLWRPKGDGLVGSARVTVAGLPPIPRDGPPAPTWELVMPNGERIVTNEPLVVAAYSEMLAFGMRSLVHLAEHAVVTMNLLAEAAETERRTQEIEARARAICELAPGDRKPSNVLPFVDPAKP